MEKHTVMQTIKRILLALVICALAGYVALAVMGEISKHKSAEELLADSLSQNTVFEYPQADGTVLYAAVDY